MCLEQCLNVWRMHRLRAVGTGDVGARLSDLNGEITLEADAAGGVLARQQTIQIVGMIIFHIAKLAFLWILGRLLCADWRCLVAALGRCRLLHEHKWNAIDVAWSRAGALWCGVVVVVLKQMKNEMKLTSRNFFTPTELSIWRASRAEQWRELSSNGNVYELFSCALREKKFQEKLV